MVAAQGSQSPTDESVPVSGGRRVLLFVDYAVPRYDQFAGARTNFLYLQLLVDMGLEVVFLPADFQRPQPWAAQLETLGIRILDDRGGADHWQSWLKANGEQLDYAWFNKPEPTDQFLDAVKGLTRAAVIYQCHDLHFLRLQRQAEINGEEKAGFEAARMKDLEGAIIAASDVVLTFSDTEAQMIRDHWPGSDVVTVPLYFYDQAAPRSPGFADRQGLVFVGSCDHQPNHDGLTWFCSEVLPRVQAQIPDIRVDIIGADPPPDILERQSRHVRVLGPLSDEELLQAYGEARIMVVPLRFGAGVKGKVIEALHYGLPLVSTSIGLEGIPGIEQCVEPRDGAQDFADEIIALYAETDRLEAMRARGQAFAARHFTRDKALGLVTDVLSGCDQTSSTSTKNGRPDIDDEQMPMLIAFHLPQFHPIPENDEWWGEGFTDWTNVRQAKPLFEGHYQPHVPADLGYYDLRDETARVAQADLAREYGIGGFCYYHYWFNGRRLLEQPVEAMLASGKPDFPFCLCWANENWTRRWDGEEQQVLVRQSYSDADDREHIRSLLPVFSDERYIRIDGKPLLLVYKIGEMPDPARTASIWREEARAAGIGELYLGHVESLESRNPADIGFDAAVEFAPDWSNKGPALDAETAKSRGITAEIARDNHLHSYAALAEEMLAKAPPDYTWFRCVTPSWDNTARRRTGANIFLDASPEAFERWLAAALDDTRARLGKGQQLVFINAWNEWAEGCHLEPDQRFGRSYLEAVRNALQQHRAGLAGGDDDVTQLREQLAMDRYRIESLQRRLEQRERAIDEMQASTSWRLTRPVRWLKERWLALRDARRRN